MLTALLLFLACSGASTSAPSGTEVAPAPSSSSTAPTPPEKDVAAQLARLPTDKALSPELHDLPRDAVRLGMSEAEFQEKVQPFLPERNLDMPGDVDEFSEATPSGGCNVLNFYWKGGILHDVAVFLTTEPCAEPAPVEVLDQ